MAEFLKGLEQSEYHAPLARIYEHGGALLFDYGMALDLYCFTQVWNVRSKLFRGKDLETITLTCGEDFDLLNLQFIQRSKRYFHMEPADIYALLIPVNYKLKKEEIRGLVEAATEDDYQKIFRNTCYGKKYEKLGLHNLEEFYNVILRDTLEKEARESPYSIAILYSYLYHKEQEVNRLTIAVECVRYGVVPDEAMQYIYNT
jgi:V/A-type H+-transporting ATPase subunit C